MMLKACGPAHHAEVVVGGIFTTANPLKSHGTRNLLSPIRNNHAEALKLCSLATRSLKEFWLDLQLDAPG